MQSKAALRQQLCQQRKTVSVAQRLVAANSAARLFATSDLFQRSQQIACYYPTAVEFDCLPIMQQIWAAQKNCYLPRIVAANKTLEFVSYQANDSLQQNSYQLWEPRGETIALQQLDLLLLPLVGFDLQGHRLGMGGGYYDRTLVEVSQTQVLLGVAYEWQGVANLPSDSWDVLLDGVLTEQRLVLFNWKTL